MTRPVGDEGSTRTAYRALSLGAGVQSSVLALLLSRGARTLRDLGYPSPDIAIFADTGGSLDTSMNISIGSKGS